ncbi:MAG: nucleoside deaminase [Bacteroidota bacterium]
MSDSHFMKLAIREGEKNPQAPFGTVIVKDGAVLVRGTNRGSENRVLHGEMDALLKLSPADQKAGGLTLYTTAEPCPMCAGAAVWSGIERIVYGVSIEWLMQNGWAQIDLSSQEVVDKATNVDVSVLGNVEQEACAELFRRA